MHRHQGILSLTFGIWRAHRSLIYSLRVTFLISIASALHINLITDIRES